MNILLTGANGFIGSHLMKALEGSGHNIALLLRNTPPDNYKNYKIFQFDLSNRYNSLDDAFQNIEVVIHLASKVHDLSNTQALNDYIQINVNGTQQLLDASVKHKIKRFIFLSTVKVHGDGELEDLNETSLLNPEDPYAMSKHKSEAAVRKVCGEHGIEYVNIRPPLVYGPGVKANFFNLMRISDKNLPLPLASIKNKRSMIYVENLCDFIEYCIESEQVKNQTFLVKDFDTSITDLIKAIKKHLNKAECLFYFPPSVLKLLAMIMGKTKQIERLLGNLTIDNSKMQRLSDWQAVYSFDEAIQKTVDWYRQNKSI